MKDTRKRQFPDDRLVGEATVFCDMRDGSSANRGNRERLANATKFLRDIRDVVLYRIAIGVQKHQRKLKKLLRERAQFVRLTTSITDLMRRAFIADWRGREIATELI